MVKRDWRDNCGAVYILVRNSKSIGFLWETDILEIRPDERGRGYGRLLADFMVKRSFDEGRSLITIEIAPSSAIPFWKRMGFTPVEARWGHGDGLYAYRRFERRLPIGAGSRVYFSIEFSTERGHFSGAAPFFRLEGVGECLPDGIVQLPERVVCFNPENTGGDDFARITVGDKVIFQDKLKRTEGARCGIQRDVGYTYFIERIRLPQR
ncbi:GNAT family N-acetyltransferase [Paracoccus onubensis]|uniref:GNAT family N-acetyltransferase n=1 Tax=Paracoccus onubensis TaxID=1675788 RepID=UPI00273159F6|nr:GNAT family N-acetyltransferase [Paracoccus onubensis]MDP0930189.1 GNAT family N-acetyltransferase [Paracoccus onubensis]